MMHGHAKEKGNYGRDRSDRPGFDFFKYVLLTVATALTDWTRHNHRVTQDQTLVLAMKDMVSHIYPECLLSVNPGAEPVID